VPEIVSRVPFRPESIGTERTSPEQARFRLFDAVSALLKSLAGHEPMVLVFDDLHDTDSAALQMPHFFARSLREAPILLIGTHREAEVERSSRLRTAIAELARESYQLPLSGLNLAETAALVYDRGGIAAEERFLATLHDTTGGNPLFLNGVVQLLSAGGKLEHQERLTAADLKLPVSVRGAIRSRLDQMSQGTSAVLSVAATFDLLPFHSCAG
jgi:predicted ATPase